MGAVFLVSPLQAPRKASPCSMHSQLHCWLRASLSHTCQLFSGLSCFSLAPSPMSTSLLTKHLRKDPLETPARTGQTGHVHLTLLPINYGPPLMFHSDFLILSALLMNSWLEIGRWSLETLLRVKKVLSFRFFLVGDILGMGPKTKHEIHLCLVQICTLMDISYILFLMHLYFDCGLFNKVGCGIFHLGDVTSVLKTSLSLEHSGLQIWNAKRVVSVLAFQG